MKKLFLVFLILVGLCSGSDLTDVIDLLQDQNYSLEETIYLLSVGHNYNVTQDGFLFLNNSIIEIKELI